MENANIFDLAAALGKALKEDEKLIRLEAAKNAYQSDKELQKCMVEYEVQQKAMENEMVKPERDMQLIDMIQKRIDTLYKEITENEVFTELNAAQTVVNDLMNAVNSTIMYNITGEIPSSCTHDCSTCGGGCSH